MTYYVKVGTVISGSNVYAIGEALPAGIGDEAMVEAGAIEWRDEDETDNLAVYENLSKKQLLAFCNEREIKGASKRLNNEAIIALLVAADAAANDTDDGEANDEESDGDGE